MGDRLRLALINREHKVCSCPIFCQAFAEKRRTALQERYSLKWEIIPLETELKPTGFRHIGEYGIAAQLKRTANEKAKAEETEAREKSGDAAGVQAVGGEGGRPLGGSGKAA